MWPLVFAFVVALIIVVFKQRLMNWVFESFGLEHRSDPGPAGPVEPRPAQPVDFSGPSRAEPRETIARHSSPPQDSIVLCQRFAPDLARPPTSFLGGKPTLPASLDWPSDSENRPLHPLAQIDCASIFQVAQKVGGRLAETGFPESGTLFVFAAADGYEIHERSGHVPTPDEPSPVRVLYFGESVSGTPEREPPAPLPELAEDSSTASRSIWSERLLNPGIPRIGRAPNFLPKVPLEPIESSALRVIQPQRVGPDTLRFTWLPWLNAQISSVDAKLPPLPPGAARIEVPETFASHWVMIERVAQALDMMMVSTESSPRSRALNDQEVAQARMTRVSWRGLREQCAEWAAEASLRGDGQEVDPPTVEAFRDWLIELDRTAETAARLIDPGSDFALAREFSRALGDGFAAAWPYVAARLWPADFSGQTLDAMRRHAVPGVFGPQHVHLALGLGTSLPDVPKQHFVDILLLQIASDPSANLMWGDVGTLRLWITPEDLRACRFDRVIPWVDGP